MHIYFSNIIIQNRCPVSINVHFLKFSSEVKVKVNKRSFRGALSFFVAKLT